GHVGPALALPADVLALVLTDWAAPGRAVGDLELGAAGFTDRVGHGRPPRSGSGFDRGGAMLPIIWPTRCASSWRWNGASFPLRPRPPPTRRGHAGRRPAPAAAGGDPRRAPGRRHRAAVHATGRLGPGNRPQHGGRGVRPAGGRGLRAAAHRRARGGGRRRPPPARARGARRGAAREPRKALDAARPGTRTAAPAAGAQFSPRHAGKPRLPP